MSISVISNIAASSSLASSGPAPVESNGLTVDFASLLSGQTLAAKNEPLTLGTSGPESKASGSRSIIDSADNSSDTGILPDQSILATMIGLAPLPQSTSPLEKSEQPLNYDKATSASDDVLATLAGQTQQALTRLNSQSMPKGIPESTSSLPSPDTELQLADLSSETANIAADLSDSTNPRGTFDVTMTNAILRHDKITQQQAGVQSPLTSEAWPKQFNEKVVWRAKNDQQTAQININPPQLGPIQITLNLSGDQANAIFASPHPEVRQAIEAALPQLKDMLASAGISLGNTNVGANLTQQNPDNPFLGANKNQSGHENAILPANDTVASTGSSQVLQKGRGLVDLFA